MPSNLKRWTAAEDNTLILYGASLSNSLLMSKLPGRSTGAIAARLHKLRIRKVGSTSYLAEPYTVDEDDILRKWFGQNINAQTIKERHLPHRTLRSIYSRAQRLGLTGRDCMLPDEDIELMFQLFLDPELPGSSIAEKFEVDAGFCNKVCYRRLEQAKSAGELSERKYLETLILRVAASKARAVYLDRLINLIQKEAYSLGPA